jgi:hypothetical protein
MQPFMVCISPTFAAASNASVVNGFGAVVVAFPPAGFIIDQMVGFKLA